ncbi:MAG: putative porin [Chthoniobacteraceae bacterium]|nr:putative porin [Chthoniobacteraceae bacterium]
MTQKTFTTWALAALCSLGCGAAAFAQDSSALIDALVAKKVLTAQEAENVRADLVKENAQTNAGKLQLSNSITSLKLYGDIRLRYQYDDKQLQVEDPAIVNQRSRERIRLRLNGDFTLSGGFFGGVQLQTTQASDSGNQTLGDPATGASGFSNYNVYISRAYFGWANDWLTLVGGKQANPFYTTDLVWDSDINPDGAVEKIDLVKAFSSLGGRESELQSSSPFGLSLVAGQFVACDNNEYAAGSDAKTDVWLFNTQLIGTAQVTPNVKVTVAPGYMTYTAGNTADFNNETAFVTTKTSNGVTTTYLKSGASGYSSQRDLSVVTLPGDVSFKVCGIKTKFLWDFAYNTQGSKRVNDVYGLTGLGTVSGHKSQDDIAWLAGVQLGENKKAGDWSVLANFRQTGLGAVDPNLNDSDFAFGQLNMQGVKTGVAYNLTDFCIASLTYFNAWNLRSDLVGGQATGGEKIASLNSTQTVQVDLSLKF